jgi:rhamnosyltransferase
MKLQVPNQSNTSAVIVTYHPDEGFWHRAELISRQAGHLVIVDNSSSGEFRKELRQFADGHNVELILNQTNLGIAAALNQGALRAIARNAEWALLFDQDSTVHDDFLTTLAKVVESLDEGRRNRLAVIGSNYNAAQRRQAVPDAVPGSWSEERFVITSGSLLNLCAFQETGPFREEFFIDWVDCEYSLRARAKDI